MSKPSICHTCKYFRDFKYGAGCGIKKQILTEKQQNEGCDEYLMMFTNDFDPKSIFGSVFK